MPNWTANAARLTPTDDASRNLIAAIAAEAKGEGNIFQLIKPCPQALRDTVAGFGPGLEGPQEVNRARYGYANWYEWCVDHWGTKWDARNIDALELNNGALVLHFDSAWSPPIGIYAELHVRGVLVTAAYAECGIGFVGIWQDGNDQEDRMPCDWIDNEGEPRPHAIAEFFHARGVDVYPAHMGG